MMQYDTKIARGLHPHFADNNSTNTLIFQQTYIKYLRNGTVMVYIAKIW